MPGILGIISKSQAETNVTRINDMVNCMLHEPFYTNGTYTCEKLGVYAGWICHKDSFCDCLPIYNEKKNIILLFFGEDFAEPDTCNFLKSKNHQFKKINASYIVHTYEEKGINCLADLNGWFSGLLIDLQKNIIILFNDRFGMQKIFYHEGQDAFYFASEAKALLKICPELRSLNTQGVAELLSCACVLENRTLFRDIYLLPYASAWIFEGNSNARKTKYFTPDVWENQPWLEKDFFYEKLRETFHKILKKYLRSNQKIGISLTGGLDTRMIMANMDLPEGKFPCYTFGGMYRDSFDVKIARKIAAVKGQTHQTIVVGKDFLDKFPHWAEKTVYVTDGYLNVTFASEIFIHKLARELAPIRLTGNWGGEVLRSLQHIKANPLLPNLFHQDIYDHTNNIGNILSNLSAETLSIVLFNDSPWLNNNIVYAQYSQLTPRSPYMDNDLVALMYRLQSNLRKDPQMSFRLIADGDPDLLKIETDRGLAINSFSPIFAIRHFIYEFLTKAEYVYDYGMPQWLAGLDHACSFMHFENLFTGIQKFNHNRLWFRNELSAYVKAILLDNRTLNRPYLNRKEVEAVVEGHTKGYRNYTTEISQLLNIELIQRLLIEQ